MAGHGASKARVNALVSRPSRPCPPERRRCPTQGWAWREITQHIEPETDMKIMYFDDYKLGVLKGDTVVDVTAVVQGIPHTGPHDLINGVIERFGEYRQKLADAVARGSGVPLASVKIR